MLSQRSIFTIFILFFSFYTFGQSPQNSRVNTSGAEAYFKVAALLESSESEPAVNWQTLFSTSVYQMMIAGNVIDTNKLKKEMIRVFSPSSSTEISTFSSNELYHKSYKDNQLKLKGYISDLQKPGLADSIKALLYPYLPQRLQSDSLFPVLFYLNYGAPDATGFNGIVINDLLHSYRIDNYKFGLLAAHEAFHSIVSTAFQQALKKNINYSAADFSLLYFLQNVSEEGIADLIDKPTLLKENSPVYNEVKQLTTNDHVLSLKYIKSIDSLMKLSLTSEHVLQQYNGFAGLASTFGSSGGHIPGRFMATIIQKRGLLQKHIKSIEDPISFFLNYNEAVKQDGLKYPVLSKESIEYLQQLKAKYWQE